MKKFLLNAMLAAATLASVPAQAIPVPYAIAPGVTLTFGGTDTTSAVQVNGQNDHSGMTSSRLDGLFNAGKLNFSTGYFLETFDAATAMTGVPASFGTTAPNPATGVTIQQDNGCALNSFNAVSLSTTDGGFAIRKGSIAGAATPLGDSTCYGVSPTPSPSNTKGSASIGYSLLLASPSDYINYFGIYYGSIDKYNDLTFYSSLNATAGTEVAVVKGEDVLALSGGPAGSQTDPKSNVYVNLDFTRTVGFRSFKFASTGVAVEVDNLVVGRASRDVPEPASLALLGAGLAALGLSRRRKAKN